MFENGGRSAKNQPRPRLGRVSVGSHAFVTAADGRVGEIQRGQFGIGRRLPVDSTEKPAVPRLRELLAGARLYDDLRTVQTPVYGVGSVW